jgi:hypothetical protein
MRSDPITVTGLSPGTSYTCRVTGSAGSATVAASTDGLAVVSASTSGSDPSGATASTPTGATAEMARTGANSAMLARFGAVFLALGVALVVLTRSRKPRRAAFSRR